jgi:hypothetical protein
MKIVLTLTTVGAILVGMAEATLTRQECVERGGTIVGDIGDGAIHRSSYRCDSNGASPLDVVVPSPGEPIAMEGEVCCGPTEDKAATLAEDAN